MSRGDVKGRFRASVAIVLSTAVLSSGIVPILYFYANKNRYGLSLDIGGMFIALSVSIMTWLAACLMFWLLSKAFNKGLGFEQVTSIWGLSYIPNFFCVVLYGLLLIVPKINTASSFSAFIICAIFIMLLVWKALYYFMLLRFVLDTTLRELLIITAVSAVVFAGLMIIGSKLGIQVPML